MLCWATSSEAVMQSLTQGERLLPLRRQQALQTQQTGLHTSSIHLGFSQTAVVVCADVDYIGRHALSVLGALSMLRFHWQACTLGVGCCELLYGIAEMAYRR